MMKKIFIIILAVVFGMASCDSYLDINQDPNSPTEDNVNSSMIFPGAEMNLASSYGNFLRIVGGYFAEHYVQLFGTSNYLDYSKFNMSATRSSSTYTQLNARCLKNLQIIREQSSASEEWGTYLAATTLRAFTYQALVDAYGETPYTEALDVSNPTPKYDEGLTVYQGILSELDEALSNVSTSDIVCTNFLFGSSSVNNWIQLANALKLKILMRMSDVQNVQSSLAALIAEDNFPTSDVAWTGIWSDESGKASPFYQEEFATYFGSGQVNIGANIALVETMKATNDPRLRAFFDANSEGNYVGGVSGTNFSTDRTIGEKANCRPVASYSMPVYLITKAEIEFFLAEYYARYGSSGNAESHYIAAIEASFATAGVSGASDIYTLHYPWDNTNYKQIIGIQKWIALSGTNNFEAWCEMRRLKYPAFGSISGDDMYTEGSGEFNESLYVPATLYTPINVNQDLGSNKVLQRFRYAESSANRNNNAPENKGDGTPVFWAE
ncbi:MAG: SusD/RagB family nutrient-binding outer membrane lipoprotein [Tannerellaceae bacterium]|nr:SusD/RagB family nutrient-binding outer membrane lipoprotein [Tannerellaceae bacterium]